MSLAEHIKFNGDFHKDCPKCKTAYGADSLIGLRCFFALDKTRGDGLDSLCKKCRKLYRFQNRSKELARWKKYYAPGTSNRRRAIVRSQTRRKHGRASQFLCARCKVKQASEWHHVVYETDGAMALCHECHEAI